MNKDIIAQQATDGKRKWRQFKIDAHTAAGWMYAAGQHIPALMGRASRMAHCADQITILHNTETGESYVERAALCRDRLCPVCSWRLAAKRTYEMQRTIDALLSEHQYKGLMLTLTLKNVERDNLGATIKHLCQSYSRLRRHRAWQRHILGYARSVEITYNVAQDTFHPHIHALLLVDDTYKATDITQREFAEMWRTAARLSYTPIVDVRYTYTKQQEQNQEKEAELLSGGVDEMRDAIVEATKYAIKPDALRRILVDEQLGEIALQLSGHHLIGYGGAIKEKRKQLGYVDSDIPSDDTQDIPMTDAGNTVLHRLAYEWSTATRSYVFVRELEAKA